MLTGIQDGGPQNDAGINPCFVSTYQRRQMSSTPTLPRPDMLRAENASAA